MGRVAGVEAMRVDSEGDVPNESLERTGLNWAVLASASAPAAQRRRSA